jgi:hypothetical protein
MWRFPGRPRRKQRKLWSARTGPAANLIRGKQRMNMSWHQVAGRRQDPCPEAMVSPWVGPGPRGLRAGMHYGSALARWRTGDSDDS